MEPTVRQSYSDVIVGRHLCEVGGHLTALRELGIGLVDFQQELERTDSVDTRDRGILPFNKLAFN